MESELVACLGLQRLGEGACDVFVLGIEIVCVGHESSNASARVWIDHRKRRLGQVPSIFTLLVVKVRVRNVTASVAPTWQQTELT